MYIKQLKIKNIRSISDFEMKFPNPAGWHVLIGDNGAGKSTIVRAVAAALIGPAEIPAARLVWKDWLKKGEEDAFVDLDLEYDKTIDLLFPENGMKEDLVYTENRHFILREKLDGIIRPTSMVSLNYDPLLAETQNCFSAAYGPFRRFTGGDESKNVIFESSPKVGAHLSVFGEDVALTEALTWLKELDEKEQKKEDGEQIKTIANLLAYTILDKTIMDQDEKDKYLKRIPRLLEGKEDLGGIIDTSNMDKNIIDFFNAYKEYLKSRIEEISILSYLKSFLNESNLLPHNTQFEGFDTDGNIIFKDGRGNTIPVVEMSDGYRSILSLLFDLIRQLIRVYGEDPVLANIKKGEMNIPVPGVVLIDEVDAHLHPTWQVRIGEWFTQYFPQIQFIVTTHSPLVCRAAKKGSIWQLAAPVNGGTHREITGLEKERLIYGNILDAYGTELFGASPVRSAESEEKKARLGKLNTLFAMGKISKEEENERQELLKILSTDDPTGF